MTILQQPDALSLSGNIKDFRISTTNKISLILKQGNNEILSQSYEPGQDGIITISLKDIIHSQLSFQLKETSLVYQQTDIIQSFTAIIDSIQTTFRVLRCGIDRFADTASNFLTHNFLTWQPSVKPVTYYSPEFLTYYAVIPSTAKLHAYFTDSVGVVTSDQTITLSTFDVDHAYTIPLQYASVAEKFENRLPAYYDVYIEDTSGNRLTYIQRYYVSEMLSEQEQWILFENSLGGIDTFRAFGSCDFTGEHTHNIAEIDEISSEYRVDTERKFQKNTGHLNDRERRWLLDFFPSLCKYIHTGSYLRPIVVIESNVTYTDRDLPSNYTFTYKYADARPLLNLPRTDLPAGDLNISVPDLGSFTVPPRLVEFPRLPLSEGALFPIQDPYSEKWNTTTAGSISDFIAERLTQNYGGGGGVGHHHNNIDLLQLLSYVEEYLMISGRKVKSGYADTAYTFLDNKSQELITFMKGLSSEGLIKAIAGAEYGKFLSGSLGTGACVKIDPVTGKSYIEVDELFVRLKAVFTELVIKELSHVGGEIVLTPASMRCIKVEELEDSYRCYFKKTDGERDITNDFVVGDQARCQTFNIKPGVHENVSNRYYWRYVCGKGDDYIDLSKTDCDAKSDIPQAGDDICQLGNRDDASRQNAIILSSYGVDTPSMKQYAGINSYSLKDKCKTCFSPSGNLITGELRVESGQKVEDVILDKVGCQVYVYTSSGNLTLNGNINETLYAEVWRGSENITDTIADSLYSWQRISTDATGDSVWNQLHEGVGKSISISDSDVVRKAMFVCNVIVNNELLTSL